METIFAFDDRNYQQCQKHFRGPRNQEYYLGDYSIAGNSGIDVRADKKAIGSCSIVRLRSKSPMFFRRSWSHIREDATDVSVLWFVRRGALSITHQSGHSVARAGDFAITQSVTPFYMECHTDEEKVHEVLHLIIPTHLWRRFVPANVSTGFCMSTQGVRFKIAQRILTDLFDDAGELAEEIAQVLIGSALTVLGDAIKDHPLRSRERHGIAEKRLQDVLSFIDSHVSDSKLCIAAIAKACGISPRYLSLVIKRHGTSFAALVWEKRLTIASEWLSQPGAEHVPVREVAYRVGFKSAEHFSRRFKRKYQVNPSDYRAAKIANRADAMQPALMETPNILQ